MKIFWAPILNFVLFHCLLCLFVKILEIKFFDWTIMGGATIIPRSLKTKQNKKNFQDRPNFFFFLIICDPFIFANNRFSKFDPLTVTGMALCVNLGPKCQNLFPLVSD
jgi:hypothetical protein